MVRASTIRAAALVLACLCVGAGLPSRADAQDEWKPIAEPDRRRPPRQAAQPEPVPRPILSPMDGVLARNRDPIGAPVADPLRGRNPSTAGSTQSFEPSAGQFGAVQGAPRPTGAVAAPPPDRDTVERSELPPAQSAGGFGSFDEMWHGLDAATFEKLLAGLELPPRSPALHALWKKLITAGPMAPATSDGDRRLLALRIEALHRSGLVAAELELLDGAGANRDSALAALSALGARAKIGAGDHDAGCEQVKTLIGQKSALPAKLRTEIMLLGGYCAGIAKNVAAAGLAADLLREEGVEGLLGLTLLDAVAAGNSVKLALPRSNGAGQTGALQVDTTDYRLLMLAGGADPVQLITQASPAVLALLAIADDGDPRTRVLAAEAASRLNVIGPDKLAEAWRALTFQPHDLADPLAAKVDPASRRALLFKAAEIERTPFRKIRVIRALLDDARRAGLYLPALTLMARQTEALAPAQEIGWFAETAIETQLAAGAFEKARVWIDFASANPVGANAAGLQHWLALADVADARMAGPRGAGLGSIESLALRGRFAPDLLHRLATVLDALDYNVPIPLWEAASRAPQPTSGHLPPTGILSQLQDAARKGELARTVLLSMQTLGPNGGEGANLIALGDAIRALKRAKLETDARRLAFEALFAGWPRTAVN